MSGDRLKLEVREREESGSRRTRRLRADGFVPGVLYGKGHARAIAVPERDLREVRLDQPIHAAVTIQLVGEPEGAKTGGMLSLVARELHVEALPMDVPEHIDVDVTRMEIGDVLRLEEIPLIDKVTFLDDPQETVIATVSVPRGFAELEEADAAEAEAAAAEAEGEEAEGEGEGEDADESAEADESSDSED